MDIKLDRITGDVSFSAVTTETDTTGDYGYGIDYGIAYGGSSAHLRVLLYQVSLQHPPLKT